MDLAAVEELGRFLQVRADRLRQIVQEINRAVYAAGWEGDAAVLFGQQQWPAHRARLSSAADHLHGLGQSAMNNAVEQRSASAVRSASRAGVGHGSSAMRSSLGGLGPLLLPLAQLGVLGLEAGGHVSQGARLGRYLQATAALKSARGAARLNAAGRVGGLTAQLRAHGRVTKIGLVGAGLDVAQYGLAVKAYGADSPQAYSAGVGATGTAIASRVVPGGELAWKLGYDLVGHELLVNRVIEPSFEGTGDDWTGHMFTGVYGQRDLTDPSVAAEVSRRAGNPFLAASDLLGGSFRSAAGSVGSWFR